MANFETGHVVNISNFKLMIDKCATFPAAEYNPSNADLTIGNMTNKWSSANNFQVTLNTVLVNSKEPINAREILFAPLNKLVTRTLNYFKSTKASAQVKKDAKGMADEIRGFGVKVKKLPDGSPDPNSVSTSHQSFVKRQEKFAELVALYASSSFYAPNQSDITINALTNLKNAMKTSNDNIGTIIAPVDAARNGRDHALYDAETGMLDIVAACKVYVKSVYGASSAEAKMIVKIKFRKKP